MMKGKIAYFVLACVVLLAFLASIASYVYGRHTMFADLTRAYYTAQGDGDLLRQCEFPFPFLKKKIEKENWQQRERIHSGIRGYASFSTMLGPQGEIRDTYVFAMPPFDEAHVEVSYDKDGKFLKIDEFGPAIIIGK